MTITAPVPGLQRARHARDFLARSTAIAILLDMSQTRYHSRRNTSDQYWSVIDIFTGQPADFFGAVLDTLKKEEVERLVGVLNDRDRIRRSQLGVER